jgi:hypothetical protein
MTTMSKNPRTPGPLSITPGDLHVHSPGEPLIRIHTVRGRHPLTWNGFREFGPVSTMRWDPQTPPPGHHPGIGVSYCATDPTTALAEVFQSRRNIRLSRDQSLTAWFPTRDLRLLDLTGLWATRNGASASLHAAPRSTCRAWSRSIYGRTVQDKPLDGLYVPSTMTGRPMVVLFSDAATAFPATPAFSELLVQPAVRMLAVAAGRVLGWPVY